MVWHVKNAPEPMKNVRPECTQLFINNEWVTAKSGKTFDVMNPATFEIVAKVQEGDKVDVDRAVRAARDAFRLGSTWRTMDATHRGLLLHKLADALERNMQMLASLNTMEVGKPFACSVGEINAAISTLRYCAGWTDKLCGKTIPMDGDYLTYTRMEPMGVIGAILPWNFPIMMMMNKVGQALAAGCCLVIKPAEQTPLTALYMAKLIMEIGMPAGVINIIPGYGPTAGAALMHHMEVDRISFTGSTEVGRMIMKASGESNLKKVTLELGGKSPIIVLPDADLDYTVEMCHFGVFFNNGQCCTAGSRTFVHEDIYDDFVRRAVIRAKKITCGDPFNTRNEQGCLIDEEQYKKVLNLIEIGKREGAKLETGGAAMTTDLKKGYFIQPTVFSNVTDTMRIAREEIFGPVQLIMKFRTIEEVIPRANDTTYGLAAAVFTRDLDRALTITSCLRAGTVWVNCYHVAQPRAPFGGYKESGMGREGCEEGILEYCEVKTVTVKTPTRLC